MSAPIEQLRRLAGRDVKDHTAIFDLYVTVGRDVDYLSIKFGMDPEDLIGLLEGYGEKIRFTADKAEPGAYTTGSDGSAADAPGLDEPRADEPESGTAAGSTGAVSGARIYNGDDPDVKRSLKEFGIALDYSGKGRLKNLPRVLVEEYVERFYPGIASEHPENDWICIESYLDHMRPGWRVTMEAAARHAPSGDDTSKKKARNKFRLFG